MADYFASGTAADVILIILAAELMWLILGRRIPLADALGLIVPGLLIIVALRFALTGAPWVWIATPLALAFPFHAMDLWRRLTRSRRP